MGIPLPPKKIREKICLECIAQCEIYLEKGKPSYMPVKGHNKNLISWIQAKTAYHNFYIFCEHYDPVSTLEKELGTTESPSKIG